jgi:hypothetical protein
MLGEYARTRGILRSEPQDGDVFLLWNAKLGRFAHTGVVARIRGTGATTGTEPWFECDTIEGNTDAGGSREGDGVMRSVRRFYPKAGDRFVRWVELDRARLDGVSTTAGTKSVRTA